MCFVATSAAALPLGAPLIHLQSRQQTWRPKPTLAEPQSAHGLSLNPPIDSLVSARQEREHPLNKHCWHDMLAIAASHLPPLGQRALPARRPAHCWPAHLPHGPSWLGAWEPLATSLSGCNRFSMDEVCLTANSKDPRRKQLATKDLGSMQEKKAARVREPHTRPAAPRPAL